MAVTACSRGRGQRYKQVSPFKAAAARLGRRSQARYQRLGSSRPFLKLEAFCKCRGILFYGEPGTGKTLAARALAGACARRSPKPVAFFSRKGADCLGKFSGEAERTLRLLFEEVRQHLLQALQPLGPCEVCLDKS